MERSEEMEMEESLCAWEKEYMDEIFSQYSGTVFDVVSAAYYLQVTDLYDVLLDKTINLI
jgi:hypothetical protein